LRVALFVPCYVDLIRPEVGVSVVRVLRRLGVLDEPYGLLRNVEGLDLVGWHNEELCCGFGGTFSVKMPDVSTAMADEKIKALEESGADTLISGDSSCLMHLEGRLRRTGHDTRVLHLAQVLDDGKAG
jgi:L-lactate dehydrogenase complex protein LldE